jgi:hypothetical protein
MALPREQSEQQDIAVIRLDARSRESADQLLVGIGTPSGGHVTLPRIGLELPLSVKLSFDRWLCIGEFLSAVRTSSAWCLGDWLIYGETMYTGRYRDAIRHTSLDYQTLRNYAWVARRFPISRRRETLSFGHHAEVASLPEPEQDFWLRTAESSGWSTSHLRREVRASLRERGEQTVNRDEPAARALPGEKESADAPGTAADEAGQDRHRLQLKVPATQMELCRVAADKMGLSVEVWAVWTLYRAARQVSVQPNDQVAHCGHMVGKEEVPAAERLQAAEVGELLAPGR